MQPTPEAILAAALKLSADERLALVTQLLDSVPPDDTVMSLDDPALVEELERRLADPIGAVAWSKLRAEP